MPQKQKRQAVRIPKQKKPILKRMAQAMEKPIDYIDINIIDIIDYLVQLCSIHAIDNKNAQVVAHLPKARALINIYKASRYIEILYKNGIMPLELLKICALFFTSIRGYNIFRDFNISKNSNSIASNNRKREDTKSLSKKKLYHYLWLTVNKFGPLVANKFNITLPYNIRFRLLAAFSEFYRQKLMYDLIENKGK